MPDENCDNLPQDPNLGGGARQDPRSLYVQNLHYHPNDLTELRRLAEQDPEIAKAVLESQREATRRMDGSFRLGLLVSGGIAISILIGAVYLIVNVGWWQTIAFVLSLLGGSHLLRVVLTGEWSDTSWLAKALNSKNDSE